MNSLPDPFFWYCRMDMATTVAALESKLITQPQASAIAVGIQKIICQGESHRETRPSDYLDIQAMLLREAGPVASRMHAGRSRQDMLATLHRLLLRDRLLLLLEDLLHLRALFLQTGLAFKTSVVPTYTNGVQAQPALFGHLMCGYEGPLARSTQRYQDAFSRLNLSPLGAAALATSRFQVDRRRIACLLGFEGLVDNAFDAAQLGIIDSGVECAQIAALMALNLNVFIQDVHAQFHHARPWIHLAADKLCSPSTLMPQKRNPVVLNRARLLGSEVVGASFTAALAAHNLCSGLTDYKRMDAAYTLELALRYFSELVSILKAVQVDPVAAMEELDADYSTSSELAAILQEASDVPLSLCHQFCSRLVDFARNRRLTLSAVPHAEICNLFQSTLSQQGMDPAPGFPFTVEEYQVAVHPMTMVENYRGEGGSSPSEVARMLELAQKRLQADRDWYFSLKASINEGLAELDQQFGSLKKQSTEAL